MPSQRRIDLSVFAARRRFDFLKMEAFYDGSLVGPSGATLPSYGSTGLEIMCAHATPSRLYGQPALPLSDPPRRRRGSFKYYSTRRQTGSGQEGATFQEIGIMNTTIDADEVFYFFKDFFPGVFSNREVALPPHARPAGWRAGNEGGRRSLERPAARPGRSDRNARASPGYLKR